MAGNDETINLNLDVTTESLEAKLRQLNEAVDAIGSNVAGAPEGATFESEIAQLREMEQLASNIQATLSKHVGIFPDAAQFRTLFAEFEQRASKLNGILTAGGRPAAAPSAAEAAAVTAPVSAAATVNPVVAEKTAAKLQQASDRAAAEVTKQGVEAGKAAGNIQAAAAEELRAGEAIVAASQRRVEAENRAAASGEAQAAANARAAAAIEAGNADLAVHEKAQAELAGVQQKRALGEAAVAASDQRIAELQFETASATEAKNRALLENSTARGAAAAADADAKLTAAKAERAKAEEAAGAAAEKAAIVEAPAVAAPTAVAESAATLAAANEELAAAEVAAAAEIKYSRTTGLNAEGTGKNVLYTATTPAGEATIEKRNTGFTNQGQYYVTNPGENAPDAIYGTLAEAKTALTRFVAELTLLSGATQELTSAEQSATGAVTLYHGTTQEVAARAEREGLQLQPGAIAQSATTDPRLASFYAERAVLQNGQVAGPAAEPAVLAFPAPPDAQINEAGIARFQGPVPPSQISQVDLVEPEKQYRDALEAMIASLDEGASMETALGAAAKTLRDAREAAAGATAEVSGAGAGVPPRPPVATATGGNEFEDERNAAELAADADRKKAEATRLAQEARDTEARNAPILADSERRLAAANGELASARTENATLAKDVRSITVEERRAATVVGNTIPPEPPPTVEDRADAQIGAAEEKAGVAKILAADEGYAASLAEAKIAYERVKTNVNNQLKASTDLDEETLNYAKVLEKSKISQASLDKAVNERLAAEESLYATTAAAAKASAAQVALLEQQALNTTGYAQTIAQTKTARAQETLAVERALATENDYIQATAAAANVRRATAARVESARLEGAGFENQTASGILLPPAGRNEQGQFLTVAATDEQIAGRKQQGLADTGLIEADNAAQTRIIKERQQLAEALARQRILTEQNVANGTASTAELNAARAAEASAAERSAAGTLTESQAIAERQIIERQLNRAVRAQVAATEKAAFDARPAEQRGTFFQQLQSGIASRGGSFRDPNDFLTGGQFLQSRFLTTAGFAVSGIATYAAFAGVQKMVQETTALQKELSLIQEQFQSLGKSDEFQGFANGIQSIARLTGEAADQVARLALQFRGAFSNLDTRQVLDQVQAAVEISKVTGISLTDITDNLTAAAIDYGTTIQDLGDKALAMQEKTGVLAKETLDVVSDLAPVAQQVGLTLDQVNAIAAIAQQTSGKSGQAIAEGLNRTLPEIQANAQKIISIFAQVAPQSTEEVTRQLALGQSGAVLLNIQKIYGTLSKANQNQILNILGTPRNIQYLIGFLQNYGKTVDNIQASQNSAGKSAEYFNQIQGTLSQTFARLRETFRTFGNDLLRLGIGEALTTIGKGIAGILSLAGGFIHFLAEANDAFGGWPARIILVVVALNSLVKVLQILQDMKIGQLVTNALGNIGSIGTNSALGKILSSGAEAGGIRGVLGKVFSRGGTAAAEAGTAEAAGGASDIAKVFGEASIGEGGIVAADTVGAGALTAGTVATAGTALVAVAALATYMHARGALQKDAAKRLTELKKDDEQTLRDLAGAQTDAQGHLEATASAGAGLTAVGKFLTGTKTGPELALDALQDKIAKTDLLPGLTALKNTLDQKKIDSSKISDLVDKLNKNSTDNKTFNEAQDTLNELQKFKNTSPALATVALNTSNIPTRDEFNATASATGQPLANGPGTAGEQAFKDQVKAATLAGFDKTLSAIDQINDLNKQLDTARADQKDGIRTKIANLVQNNNLQGADLATLRPQIQALRDQYNTTGVLPNAADLTAIKDLAGKVGTNFKLVVDGINQGQQTAAAAQKLLDIPASFDTLQSQFKGGSINSQTFVDRVKKQLDVAKGALATVTASLGRTDAVVKQAQDEVNKYQDAVDQAQLQLSQSRIQAATLNATTTGQNANVVEPIKQRAILQELPNQQSFASRLTLAQDYVQSQQAYVQFAAQNAGSEEEANAILKRGVKIPPQVRSVFIEAQLQAAAGTVQRTLQAVADSTGLGLDAVIKGAADIAAAGGDAAEYLAKIVQGKLDQLNAALSAGVYGGGAAGGSDQQRAALAQQKSALEKTLFTLRAQAAALNGAATAPDNASGTQQTEQQVAQAKEQLDEAKLNLAKSQASGDPVAVAQISKQIAEVQLAYAEKYHGKNSPEYYQALAALSDAEKQVNDALVANQTAMIQYLQAANETDPVKVAQLALQLADIQLAAAKKNNDVPGQFAAMTARLSAQRQLQQSLFDAYNAQTEFLIAVANANGDTVKAAQLALKEANDKLSQDLQKGYAPDSAQVKQDRAQVVQQAAALRDAALNKNLDDIQFELDMGTISTGQAITKLQNLANSANITETERRNILRQIKQLKDQLTKDLQFNLPTDLQLPTLYEARRLTESGGGTGSYQDNRQINVNINGSNMTPQQVEDHVVKVVSAPPRVGTYNKSY